MKIILITPTRNEEDFIDFTLSSILSQTLLPIKWVIVDDGSTDNTGKIIKNFMNKASFIEYVYLPNRGYRKPAQGVIEAFNAGYKKIGNIEFDIIAKLDADLKLPSNTLETICLAFKNNPKLGITGGTRYEQDNNTGPFKKVLVPNGFVGGPYKFYRKQCFKDINGLIHRAGWDGVDTIRANMMGWETGEIESLKIYHMKSTGTAKGEGLRKACEKYGDVSYYMGGYFWYFVLRVIGRSIHSRNPKVGYFMLRGYFKSLFKYEIRESSEFRIFLKRVQLNNMKYWFKLLSRTQNL